MWMALVLPIYAWSLSHLHIMDLGAKGFFANLTTLMSVIKLRTMQEQHMSDQGLRRKRLRKPDLTSRLYWHCPWGSEHNGTPHRQFFFGTCHGPLGQHRVWNVCASLCCIKAPNLLGPNSASNLKWQEVCHSTETAVKGIASNPWKLFESYT